jgi:hypothetical protein
MTTPKKDVVIGKDAVYVLRAGMPVFVKTADICSITGKTNQWIGQLTSQGIINKKTTPHGNMYDIAEALHAYCTMLDSRAENKIDESEAMLNKEKLKADVEFKKSKTVKSRLEAQELEGKMHRAEDIAAMTEDLIYTVRSDLNALPGRLARDVAAETDPAVVEKIIRKEAIAIMHELALYKYDAKKYEELVGERNKLEMMLSKHDNED